VSAWRYIEPAPGMKGWVQKRDREAKPRNGTPITVTGLHAAGAHAYVETPTGDCLLPLVQIDCGREWRTARGAWIPENDPRVRCWLEKAIGDIRGGGQKISQSDNPDWRAAALEDLERVMRRNGWPVPIC
jgi:hypothetical protein